MWFQRFFTVLPQSLWTQTHLTQRGWESCRSKDWNGLEKLHVFLSHIELHEGPQEATFEIFEALPSIATQVCFQHVMAEAQAAA